MRNRTLEKQTTELSNYQIDHENYVSMDPKVIGRYELNKRDSINEKLISLSWERIGNTYRYNRSTDYIQFDNHGNIQYKNFDIEKFVWNEKKICQLLKDIDGIYINETVDLL